MAWEGLFGEPLSADEADSLTQFQPDQQTWPWRGMLALAEKGAQVTNIENIDAETFVDDPAAALLKQLNGDRATVDHILSVADVTRETGVVRDLLRHPSVSLLARTPTPDDLLSEIASPNTAVICNVNYRALVAEEGYNGHFVLVDRVSDGHVILQDPGLPPLDSHKVPLPQFVAAWQSPDPGLANILSAAAA